MATAPSEADPWAWNAWAQTQDPSAYGSLGNQTAVPDAEYGNTPNGMKASAFALSQKQALQNAGIWRPEWDNAQKLWDDTVSKWSGNAEDQFAEPDFSGFDFSPVYGYSTDYYRGPGYTRLYAVKDAQGNIIDKSMTTGRSHGSMTGSDYATAAAVLAAGYGAGQLLGAGGTLGSGASLGAGAGEVSSLGTVGQFALPEVGALAAPTATVGGGTAGLSAAQVGALTAGGGGAVGAGGTAALGSGASLGSVGLGSGALGVTAAPAVGSTLGSTILPTAAGSVAAGGYGAWAQIGASLLGSAIQSNQISKAASTQAAAADRATAASDAQYQQTRADQAGYRARGDAAGSRLAMLLGLGGAAGAPGAASDPLYGSLSKIFTGADLESEPGYKFGLDQGNKNIQGSAAARGGLFSGATLKALQRYGTDYGGTKYNEAFARDDATKTRLYNQLAGVSGTGQTATQATGAAGFANAANAANYGIGAANAGAAASLAQGNILQNSINQGVSMWQRQQNPDYWGGP